MRMFIAVNFNDRTRERLTLLRDELRSRSERGNFSAPENLHLTLAFLGECPPRDATPHGRLRNFLEETSFAPFDITVDCIGRFQHDGGDLWWAGVRESKPLLALQTDLSDRLTAMGFSLEHRRYSPHITLGREVVTSAEPWSIEPFGEAVQKIDLMKSERIADKLTYTKLVTQAAANQSLIP